MTIFKETLTAIIHSYLKPLLKALFQIENWTTRCPVYYQLLQTELNHSPLLV